MPPVLSTGHAPQRSTGARCAAVPGGLLLIDAVLLLVLRTPAHSDLSLYLIPWFSQLRQQGFAALGTTFSNYTPPYLYLLWLSTPAGGILSPAGIIRGLSVAFNVMAALAVFWMLRRWGHGGRRATCAAAAFLLLPEQVVNSAIWAQCDIIYTLFLIACVQFAIERRGWTAAAMLGIALACKLQATFIAPFVLYLLLSRQLRWRHLLAAPVIYVLLAVPAALAGRPWHELLTIYLGQAKTYLSLSRWAPNPYLFVEALLPASGPVQILVTKLGVLVGVAIVVALALAFLRLDRGSRRERLLLMATLSLAAMPYVLPRMHERYFFPAGAMAFLLFVERPATWPIVAMIQVADLAAYAGYFGLPDAATMLVLGLIAMTGVIASLVALLKQADATARAAPAPVS